MSRSCRHMVVLLVLLASVAQADWHGYEYLCDWSMLPMDRTHLRAGLVSSYDRAGGNNDYNQYQSPPGFLASSTYDGIDVVVTELTGPGVLTRFWMPHAAANTAFPLKVYVDGVLRISTDTNVYLDGLYGYAAAPLTATLIGGQYSYEPIAFQQSCRIESANYTSGTWARTHHYYQWTHYALPAGETVAVYTGTLSADQQVARAAAVAMINQVGQNPAGASPAAEVIEHGSQTLPAGGTLALCERVGSGCIRRLSLGMPAGVNDAQLDGLRLVIRYDDASQPAIDVPVSHFFGAGHSRVAYRSLPLGTDGAGGYYCYWPMPFRQGVRVELNNSADESIDIAGAAVEAEAGPVDARAGYLHAVHHEQTTVAGQQHHQVLNVGGAGHYVGNLLYLQADGDNRRLLEGDDIVTVNPGTASEHVLYGTGLEDAYNGGYYYNHVLEQTDDGDVADPVSGFHAFSGLLYMDFYDLPGFQRTRADQYRWLIADAVPFTDGIDVQVENYGNGEGVLFGSTAFYYALSEPVVAGAHIFYNHSILDGGDAAANATDDSAIDASKQPLAPGGTATAANLTAYGRGINGVMLDIPRLSGEPTAEDFTFAVGTAADGSDFAPAPAPQSVTVRPGAGVDGSDRITIIWADGAIRDCWLRVEVLPTAGTGLAAAEVFYWGNLRGDTDGDGQVNVLDLLKVQQNYLKPPGDPSFDPAADVTADGTVNVFDLLVVRQNYLRKLPLLQPQPAGP